MVLVALDHVSNARDERGQITGVAADLVVVRVRLDVRLVDDVEAQPVTEVEPVGVVGVVRAADGVEVRLLDQARIRLHQLACDCPSTHIVVVVPVDAVDPHGLPVDEQARIACLDASEPHAAGNALPVRGAPQADDERVERRVLRRPTARRADRQAERVTRGAPLERRGQDRAPVRIEQARLDRRDVGVQALHPRVDRERPVAVVVVELPAGEHVGDVRRPGRVEEHLAGDARVPPLVLVLHEARVGPADDRRQDPIRPQRVDETREVELRGGSRVLGQPDRVAVHQDVEHPLDAPEVEHDSPARPLAREPEVAAIQARRITLGHGRR